MRRVYFFIGVVFVAVGFVGAFLPVLPTTPFLLVALACFSRSSPRLETWLLTHPRFGSSMRAWRERGAIPAKAKLAALAGMSVSLVVFLTTVSPGPALALGVGAFMLAGLAYVFSRPSS